MNFLEALEHHILDHKLYPGFVIHGFVFPITMHLMVLWIAAAAMVAGFSLLARGWPAVPKGPRAFLDIFVVFIRDGIVLPNTGEAGRPYVPYFLTLFFFILINNLIGLLPGAATPTGNISVTAALALCTFGLINVAGIREYGFAHHFHNFIPHGLPWWIVPLIFPLEIMGLLTKTFALTVRLFANMIAGHIVMLAFISLIFFLGTILVAPLAVGVAVGIGLIEVFVCFLQAYIFTLLTSVFVGTSLQPH